MTTSSRELQRALVELLWSQWTALGVSGWRRATERAESSLSVAVDPEALLLLTASLAEADPRLRDEVTDWCVSFGRYVSKVRLKNLIDLGIGDRDAFHAFAATVNDHALLSWPDAGMSGRRFVPTDRSSLVAHGSFAVTRVRARLIFGVGARAEILVFLASEQHWNASASELADRVNYGRRNVVESLAALVRAGLVREVLSAGPRRYSLADPVALHAILGPFPERFIDWGRAFKACWIALRTLQDYGEASAIVRTVEASKAAEIIGSELMTFWLSPPWPAPSGPSAWDQFGRWMIELVETLRDPSRAEFAPRRRRRRPRKVTTG